MLESSGLDRAIFTRNDGYWRPEDNPAARLQIISITDDNARLSALQSGQIDLAFARANQAPAYQALVDSGELTATDFLGPMTAVLLNPGAAPQFTDPRVREALNIGIDRRQIVEQFLGGAGVATAQPFPEGMVGHVPAADDVTYDPERARRLLAEAGAANLAFDTILTGTEPLDRSRS